MPSTPDPTDVHVGTRMRLRRIELRLSQQAVADGLEISFQQVQKYETGRNRIAASRLVALSTLLEVTPGYFFVDAPGQRSVEEAQTVMDVAATASSTDGLKLNMAFNRIVDMSLRATIIALIEAIGNRPD